MRKIVVTGAGGFIGTHLVRELKNRGDYVVGVDIKYPKWSNSAADEFYIQDLRYSRPDLEDVSQVYHLAADMGGIGYIENFKAKIVRNNSLINLNILDACNHYNIDRLLFSSSACVYPAYLQNRNDVKKLAEEDAYPADAEDGYGWEKLMMERNCRHYMEDYGVDVRIARFHNIYGPEGEYDGGREKAPAALCRKVIQSKDTLVIWGNGKQTRSFCYVDDCVEALIKLMASHYDQPINIGTDELVSIDGLADIIMDIAGKDLKKRHAKAGNVGVAGRNADLTKAKEFLDWEPKITLRQGLMRTYTWIQSQICP